MLPELIENIMKSDNMRAITMICKLFADDRAYNVNNIFRYLTDKGTLPYQRNEKNVRDR